MDSHFSLLTQLIIPLPHLLLSGRFDIEKSFQLFSSKCLIGEKNLFFKWAIPGLSFLLFSSFQITIQLTVIAKSSADDWMRTADLWIWKRPLYQLRPNYSSFSFYYFCPLQATVQIYNNLF